MNKIMLSVTALAFSTALSPAFAQDASVSIPDFATADADSSGGVSMAELEVALPGFEAEAFAQLDTNSDDELSQAEYAALAASQNAGDASVNGEFNTDFASADADKNGGVSMAELELVLPGIDEARFKLSDIDGDGALSEEEYATFAAPQNASETGLTTDEQEMSGDDTDPTTGEETEEPAPAPAK